MKIYEGYDGTDGIKMIHQVPIHYIITDWDMPQINGLEFTKQAKQIMKERYDIEIKVLLVTSNLPKS